MRNLSFLVPTRNQSTKTLTSLFSVRNLFSSITSNNGHQNIKQRICLHFFQDPSKIQSLNQAKLLHALVITMGSLPSQDPVFLHNNIITKYLHFGNVFAARKLFDSMPRRNVVSYNSMIGSYCRDEFLFEAWELFSDMRRCGLKPTQFTFGSLLSCHELSVCQGMQLHSLIDKSGLIYVDAYAGTVLLGMYGRHGCLDEAVGVFESMPCKNLVTWNSLISVFGQMGLVEDCIFTFLEMKSQMGVSEYTIVGVLSSLKDFDVQLGEQIHGLVIKSGFDMVGMVSNALINMYAKFDMTFQAEQVFEKAVVKDIVSWNTIISAEAESNQLTKALGLFQKMCLTGLMPNETTLINVLKCFSRLQILSHGEYIHAKMIKKGCESDVYAGSALVDYYSKCEKVQEAHHCFNEIKDKSLVSWNSLMLGYSNRGLSYSVKLFQEMLYLGYRPKEQSFSTIIKSSPEMELLQLHSLSCKMGYLKNDYVLSSLISSYARNGLVSHALLFASDYTLLPVVSSNVIASVYNRTGQYYKTQELYAAMEDPDTISWNILIAACSRNGDYKETFELFDHMRRSNVCPDNYTYASLFSVCTELCNLALGSSLHSLTIKTNFEICDTFVCNIMIDMYGKCGELESSVKIFNEIVTKNIISWTTLVSALGLHGYANQAIEKFREMEGQGFKPDKVSLLAVLSACRHVGLVHEGMDLFNQMKTSFGLEPELDHYVVVVDLLAKYGHLREAEKLIKGMPIPPNALIWRSFFRGCKNQRSRENISVAA